MRFHHLQLGILHSLNDRLVRFRVIGPQLNQLRVVHQVVEIVLRLLGVETLMISPTGDPSRVVLA